MCFMYLWRTAWVKKTAFCLFCTQKQQLVSKCTWLLSQPKINTQLGWRVISLVSKDGERLRPKMKKHCSARDFKNSHAFIWQQAAGHIWRRRNEVWHETFTESSSSVGASDPSSESGKVRRRKTREDRRPKKKTLNRHLKG